MANLDIPAGNPLFPWNVKADETTLEREAGLVLCISYPRWETDDGAWHEFEQEVIRIEGRVGSEVLRSLIYLGDQQEHLLGIFILKTAIPERGIASLF